MRTNLEQKIMIKGILLFTPLGMAEESLLQGISPHPPDAYPQLDVMRAELTSIGSSQLATWRLFHLACYQECKRDEEHRLGRTRMYAFTLFSILVSLVALGLAIGCLFAKDGTLRGCLIAVVCLLVLLVVLGPFTIYSGHQQLRSFARIHGDVVAHYFHPRLRPATCDQHPGECDKWCIPNVPEQQLYRMLNDESERRLDELSILSSVRLKRLFGSRNAHIL